jgi:hypothetical protein
MSPRQRISTRPTRRGGIYVAVLATATIVTVIGLASLAAWRVQAAAANAAVDAAEARLYAEAGLDHAAYYLSTDPSWRTNRTPGQWWSRALSDGNFTVTGADPVDSDFTNRPYDPLELTCTGRKGSAVHMTTVRLQPKGTPIDALAMAVHTAGTLRLNSGTTSVTGAPLSTNGSMRLDATLNGSAQVTLTRSGTGTCTGTVTLLAPTKPMPPSGIFAMYRSLATTISPGATMTRQVLGPGVNTVGGGTNSDGVYYISAPLGITISNCRVTGTLVIDAPNQVVTISGSVFMQPSRPDFPVLIVNGKLTMQADSTVPLSEATNTTNFNPAGAPYQGVADADQTDTYPSEIDGLVHSNDKTIVQGNQLIRGGLICESNDGTQAIYFDATPQIIYDPTLYTSPPMGYTTSVTMKIAPGGWRQSVLP